MNDLDLLPINKQDANYIIENEPKRLNNKLTEIAELLKSKTKTKIDIIKEDDFEHFKKISQTEFKKPITIRDQKIMDQQNFLKKKKIIKQKDKEIKIYFEKDAKPSPNIFSGLLKKDNKIIDYSESE